ncbi:hypothetical protein FOZ61_008792 [Perkinsus olseni]|uniref:Cyclic nucleotide-binding domain-containing protein n=1 Tax=Perkinsus olseni TaxID=32597 RepID=A0A7J6MH65_PEROL|nr:hypothetical protein FOZ61_008792 [Perkinsus olseni]KAF4676241.1 hypothetical protein FOL46_006250 [Perkinsus olseni]
MKHLHGKTAGQYRSRFGLGLLLLLISLSVRAHEAEESPRVLLTTVAGDEVEDSTALNVLKAVGWAALSAISLPIGSTIAIFWPPGQRVSSILLAFGSGSLLEALSIELFGHVLHATDDNRVVYSLIAGALIGCLIFVLLNKMLNDRGGFYRHENMISQYVMRVKMKMMESLLRRLKQVPMLSGLRDIELYNLAKSLESSRYRAGDLVICDATTSAAAYSPLFFVVSGEVLVTTRFNDGVESTCVAGPNAIFGQMTLCTGVPVVTTALTQTPVKLLRLPAAEVQRLLLEKDSVREFVSNCAVSRLSQPGTVFADCSEETLARLVSAMTQCELQIGDVLFFEVDRTCPIYLVILGQIEVWYESDPAVASLGHGSIENEFVSEGVPVHPTGERILFAVSELIGTEHLVYGHSVAAVATATKPTVVFKLQRHDLDQLMEHDGALRAAMEKYATRQLSGRLQESANTTPRPTFHRSSSVVFPGLIDLKLPGPSPEVPVLRPSMTTAFDRAVPHDPPRLRSYTQTFVDNVISTPHSTPITRAGTRHMSAVWADDDYTISKIARHMSPVAAVAHLDVHDLVSVCDDESSEASEALSKHSDVASGHALDNEEVVSVCSDGKSRRHAATVVWLGILIDGIPESLVIGILVSTSSLNSVITFVFGVFMANLPEAMSSSATMLQYGMSRTRVFIMWSSIVILTAVGAALGSFIFPPIPEDETTLVREVMIAMIEGCGGGAMLAMIAETALPEASHASSVTGLVGTSTVAGFLSTLFVKSLA